MSENNNVPVDVEAIDINDLEQLIARACENAIQIGVQAAIDYIAEEREAQKQTRRDRRLRNTKLLLKNYRSFKQHSMSAVFKSSQLKESAFDILDIAYDKDVEANLFVESIRQSRERTFIMVKHIEDMLNVFKVFCKQSGKSELERRYEAIYLLYIDDEHHTYEEVADIIHVDVSTVYSDVRKALPQLSALFFGVDYIQFE